ncbi:hypothetical protein GGI11_001276 [Coemansia sp. RSA 2049]|nr:hypothetical protein H4217_004015 [Coemansia sp. RSA 1939]KAJ2523771.1 hypothetical protein GGI11_001276 [Coemansia sp. RSA 2049]KAJ2607404.1 hypothetical protein EV177_005538 [Coemansia sp. RSA 1804]KAJ2685386.1 hypothetical protein GGH99_003784 [Coemansia sp. RSA 1285]
MVHAYSPVLAIVFATIAAGAAVSSQSNNTVSTSYNTNVADYDFGDANYSYCGADYPDSSTYTAVKDATLEFLQLVVRHGDRAPSYFSSDMGATWTCSPVESIYLNGIGSKQQGMTGSYQQQIEIPQWNGKYGYANKAWSGSCDEGQLTDKGVQQHLDLGARLRSVYVEKLGFLPYWLSNTSQMYLRTTSIWRTKNSAEALLNGLWPYRGIDPSAQIPIHTYPSAIETMVSNIAACPGLGTAMSQITNSAEFGAFYQSQAALITKLDNALKASGSSATSGWSGYVDVLLARQCHGMKLPCSSDGVCITDDDVKQVMRNGHYELAFIARDHPLVPQSVRLYIGSFIGTLRDQLQDAVNRKAGDLKFALYSAHDETIIPILGALKASNTDMLWPAYAANLALELWKKKDGSRVVRVVLNGRVLTLQEGFQWCDMNACPADQFFKYLETYIPSDITTECA